MLASTTLSQHLTSRHESKTKPVVGLKYRWTVFRLFVMGFSLLHFNQGGPDE
jgi:hypothetical protein